MYRTKFGLHNGGTWEGLIQQVFKRKYAGDGYQQMVASPGDYGIEGFTKKTGLAFQCYCPEKQYTQEELYEKQRGKITKDLNKLRQYQKQLKSRLGDTKIGEWIFVTPDINHNKLLEHIQKKQKEVIEWGLSFISTDFSILVRDADFYATEIYELQSVNGSKTAFAHEKSELIFQSDLADRTEYEENINRKNAIRVGSLGEVQHAKLNKLNSIVLKKWFEGEGYIKKIENNAPTIYYRLAIVINQYEEEVSELSLMWNDPPEELVNKVRESLYDRLREELPDMSVTDHRKIADHMVAKWIAICPLDFE